MLDQLCSAGEVVWAGAGALAGGDGWVALGFADTAPLILPPTTTDIARTPLHDGVLDALDGGQALFFRALADRVRAEDDTTLLTALWDLVWAGLVSNDTLAPLRALLAGGRTSHGGRRAAPRTRFQRPGRPSLGRRPVMPSRTGPPAGAGRWTLVPDRETDPTLRAHAVADTLLERYGVLTRGSVLAEGTAGGFAGIYPVLRAYEEAGRARRGYFVAGLGGAQFASPGAVDRLRVIAAELDRHRTSSGHDRRTGHDRDGRRAIVLAATDPANPYGAALPWPERPVAEDGTVSGHRPGRKAGALVVLVDGRLVLYVERGGRTLLSWTAGATADGTADVAAATPEPGEDAALRAAADALALAVADGWLGTLSVERADGASVHDSPLVRALADAGFRATPRGLRLRG